MVTDTVTPGDSGCYPNGPSTISGQPASVEVETSPSLWAVAS